MKSAGLNGNICLQFIGFGTSVTPLGLQPTSADYEVAPTPFCRLSVQCCMGHVRSHTEGMLHRQLADLQCGRNLCALEGRLLRLRLVLTRAGAVSKMQCLTEYEG